MGKSEASNRGGVRRPAPGVPLARALSKLGWASRRQAIDRVLAGEVSVDGVVVRDPGHRVSPERADIRVQGVRVRAEAPCTLLLHKPRGVVATRLDPQGRPTIYELLGTVPRYVAPVGRLDLASTGLLLLTNDSRFADWILDPAHGVRREYVVTVRGELRDEDAQRIRRGIRSEGELLRARSVEVLKRSGRETHVRVALTEGRNRELRRLFEAVQHEVTRLMRISFGGLALGALAPGRWRYVGYDELRRAFPDAPIRRPAGDPP